MRLPPYLTAAALGALLCLRPGASAARVDVSIQVAVAGGCVGGVAWALSASWSNNLVRALASTLRPMAPPARLAQLENPDRLDHREADEARPLFFLPLLVLPLP